MGGSGQATSGGCLFELELDPTWDPIRDRLDSELELELETELKLQLGIADQLLEVGSLQLELERDPMLLRPESGPEPKPPSLAASLTWNPPPPLTICSDMNELAIVRALLVGTILPDKRIVLRRGGRSNFHTAPPNTSARAASREASAAPGNSLLLRR